MGYEAADDIPVDEKERTLWALSIGNILYVATRMGQDVVPYPYGPHMSICIWDVPYAYGPIYIRIWGRTFINYGNHI